VKTERLISLLANQVEAVDAQRAGRRLLVYWAAGSMVSVLLLAGAMRFNPALPEVAQRGMFWVRGGICASLALAALMAVERVGRPAARMGLVLVGLALPVIAMWLLAIVVLLNAPSRDRVSLVLGHTALVCPWLITFLALPQLVALIWALRGAAPTRLRVAGAAAGFAAGASGALVYTLHCPELAPPFFATWYLLGMLIPAGLGACLGQRLLRW
jgi:hypothetical protein